MSHPFPAQAEERQPLDYASCYGGALAFYVAWQLLYIFKTEIVDADYIRHHPDEFTSLRWITRDGRNGMHRLCKRAMVAMDLMRPGEAFDETTKKTKLTFWAAQLVYTILTLLPVPLVWHSKTVHAAFPDLAPPPPWLYCSSPGRCVVCGVVS